MSTHEGIPTAPNRPASEDERLGQLGREIARLAARESALEERLADAYDQVADRDRELDRLRSECDKYFEAASRTRAELNEIKRERLWRLGVAWWLIRRKLLRRRVGR